MTKSDILRNIPIVEAINPATHHQRPKAIFLTPSWTTSDAGAAYGRALTWNCNNDPQAAHYVVDAENVYQCIPPKQAKGYDNGSHPDTIFIEMCMQPEDISGDVHMASLEDSYSSMVLRTSALMAELIREFRIRPRVLTQYEWDRYYDFPTRKRGGIIHSFDQKAFTQVAPFVILLGIEKGRFL